MEKYDDSLPVGTAVGQFLDRFGIPADAYSAPHFSVPVGPMKVKLPNLPSRVRVARFHDIHHVLTGYPANWRGEAEIGAWEIATSCGPYFVAWFLNGGAVAVGLVLWPRAVWRAWKRGWRTRTNLYHGFEYEPLLELKISELREKIGLPEA